MVVRLQTGMAAGCRHLVYQLTPVYLPEPPAGVAAVSERPRCGPIGPSGYLLPGIRLLVALVVAHPRLGMAVGTEMALQLMSFVRGSRTKNFLKLPPLEISCVDLGKTWL